MTHRAIKFFPGSLVVVLLLIVSSLGQTKNENSRYLFRVNIAGQPDCPIRVVLDSIRNSSSPVTPVSTDDLYIKPPENVMLRLENISKLSVAAYALASKGNGFHNVQVNVFLKPFRAGDRLLRGFGTGGSEQIEYSLDYVLFSDGTSWGPDRFGRSRQIALYFEGRNAALDQLRRIVAFYPGPQDFLEQVLALGSYISHDAAGDPNPETIKRQYRDAWTHVINMLRNSSKREKESKEVADKLEAAIPTEK